MFKRLFPSLLVTGLASLAASATAASALKEMPEQKFLDLVEAPGHVLITAKGVEAVNAEARRQGLRFPAVGYWSPDNVCFSKPPRGDCNAIFRR